jgi:hypothetical protein
MQRAVVIVKPKRNIDVDVRSLFEKATYISMLSGFVGMIYYLAINCYHAV